MLVDTYTKKDGGVDKVCIMIPPDLPLGGEYKFEAGIYKAHETGFITIGAPSLRPLTVDERIEQVGFLSPGFGISICVMLIAFVLIGFFKAGK